MTLCRQEDIMTKSGESYRGDGGLVHKVSTWLDNWRAAARDHRQLAACGRGEIERMARDIGVYSADDLLTLVAKGPGGADLLLELAATLGIQLEDVRHDQPRLVRDLQYCCSTCNEKRRCAEELRDGTADAHYAEYCPNAPTLAALRP